MLYAHSRFPRRLIGALAAALILWTPVLIADASGHEIVVDENPEAGWAFNTQPPYVTPAEFSGDEASIGIGSLHADPITNDDGADSSAKLILRYLPDSSVSMGDFDGFSIDFLIDDAGSSFDANQFYVNLYTISPSPTSWYSCRYDYIADSGSTADWTALAFDAGDAADVVSDRAGGDCGSAPAEVPGHDLLFISVNLGDTSFNDTGVGGYFDNAQLTIDGATTTWDFELPIGGKVTGGGWFNSPAGAMVTPDTLVWDQGFDTDADGWLDADDAWYGSIDASGGTALVTGDADSAPFSRFDGYRDSWAGTWTAEVDVYLDPAWATGEGFDYSVAANGSDGKHQRDYIFHVGVVEDQGPIVGKALLVNGSNNTDFTTNPFKLLNDNGGNYHEVNSAGWYTLQHVFRDAGGYLAVDLNLLDSGGNLLWTATRENVADTIPGEVGGNRYAWFTHIDVTGGIEIDNHQLYFPWLSPEGRTSFGLSAQYTPGNSVPTGSFQLTFQAGDLNVHANSFDWLVVTDDLASLQGTATVNGAGAHRIKVWARDGGPGGTDTLRVQVWTDEATPSVFYDTSVEVPLGGGQVKVH